jgi:hypothetical protein
MLQESRSKANEHSVRNRLLQRPTTIQRHDRQRQIAVKRIWTVLHWAGIEKLRFPAKEMPEDVKVELRRC